MIQDNVFSLFPHQHLLAIKDLSVQDLNTLLNRAEANVILSNKIDNTKSILHGRTQINLFFEASTRTQSSFELAGKRLGANVLSIAIGNSSIKKGETLLDTATTLNAMKPDILVFRHSCAGAAALLAQKVDCCVINAGDGAHEHPTQALLDALTIKKAKGHIEGLTVAICGDILHSRVARSNILSLNALGAHVRVVAPSTLLPTEIAHMSVEVFNTMKEGLKDVDVIMMLRLQHERMTDSFIPSTREYFHYFGLHKENLAYAKNDCIILHPGPINRGVEIASDVADGPQSMIHTQVEMGIAVRMAVMEALLDSRSKISGEKK
ncbi:aspartate carbamoyltransferase catalytic subunit [Bartonella fuyuanensis]|uniref:Aspartate carbamoyltransferase n=1 Tax=Bartonella fuyuanensis TaxID=1460968 RepID=A0A840DTB7_9HYPH|nr:aspartate carbamoyltransferase catalytic subunit [Bartonella fuyuanensis]MBB4076334.1 aspartate carbamoyltransferase catalytic subunit [Bartonella fuyuanensis]